MIKTKDIRFDYTNAERLILKGILDRQYLAKSKDGKVTLEKMPVAITKRYSTMSDLEILNHGEWIFVRSGDEAVIDLIYADDEVKDIKIEVAPVVEEPKVVEPEPVVEEVKAEEPVVEEPTPIVEEETKEEVVDDQISVVEEEPTNTVKSVTITTDNDEPLVIQAPERDLDEPIMVFNQNEEEASKQQQSITIQKSSKKHHNNKK